MSLDPLSPPPRQPALTPYNPYAPPGAAPPPAPAVLRRNADAFGDPKLKWIYLAAEVALIGVVVGGLVLEGDLRTVSVVIGVIANLVSMVAGLGWLHLAWTTRPFAHAHQEVSPGGAVGRLFIPFYGLYWMFAVNLEIAASVERMPLRRRMPDRRVSLDVVALAACVLQLLTYAHAVTSKIGPWAGTSAVPVAINLVRSNAWLVFMFVYERRRSAIAR